ncbi:MAG: cyclic pyranopterin monophosphate synthase MoaC [Treponema sp.]
MMNSNTEQTAGLLNHFDSTGNAIMVDIGGKADTQRIAEAHGFITMNQAAYHAVRSGTAKKGDVLGTARIAGIMAAKKTAELIPLCHTIMLTHAGIQFILCDSECKIEAVCCVKTTGKTGAEMEALTGTSAALLTIYDMCKALDRGMTISGIEVVKKDGGKSGLYER